MIRNSGFTLIEMSIVLVVIGLIVSAVLVGQTLILSARIHSTVAQYNKLVTGAKTFQAKYRWLPGDMIASYAQIYNLSDGPCYQVGTSGPMNTNPSYATLPPDGCEWDWWPTTGNQQLDRGTAEGANFYTHLTRSGLIEGDFGASKWTATAGDQSMVWMEPRLKRGVIYPDYCTNRNCVIMGATFVSPASGQPGQIDMFTPFEAYGIDIKLDDGNSVTGIVSALSDYDDIARNPLDGSIHSQVNYTPSGNCCVNPSGVGKAVCSNINGYDIQDENFRCTIQLKW